MARVTLQELRRSKPVYDRAKVEATTEADIRRHGLEDGECGDIGAGDRAEFVTPPALIRKKLGMTQEAFAAALRIPVATLRNWEQGRVAPDPAARALLRIVAHDPEAAFAALAA